MSLEAEPPPPGVKDASNSAWLALNAARKLVYGLQLIAREPAADLMQADRARAAVEQISASVEAHLERLGEALDALDRVCDGRRE
ncbi:hypothetical protein [Acidocella sp.]|uniref:hypothetical protein n=1 Tax=Acidocella sp. TaxID=50710 RepID=UPI0026049A92|nr:hypothetical protein [Acidocella sp.]